MTVIGISTVVGVGNSSILRTFQDSGTSSPKRNGKYELKRKTTPRTDNILIRNSKISRRKISKDLRKDLLDYSVKLGPSTIRKRLLKVSHKATRLRKKHFPIQKKVKKRVAWAKKYQFWTVND
ncbi:HTH_Tnp_Tc3_2 domain-containing protein [Trichonephila clavipes]|nr:HTH_Tnp_Tc3_2 domain-containing protein [Trichonephila clavipes]